MGILDKSLCKARARGPELDGREMGEDKVGSREVKVGKGWEKRDRGQRLGGRGSKGDSSTL